MSDFMSTPFDDSAAITPLDPLDPATHAAVLAASPTARLDDVQRERLVRQIVGDAAWMLRRMRQRPWFAVVAEWSRTAIPISVAAALLAGAVLWRTPVTSFDRTTTSSTRVSLVSAVLGETSANALAESVSGTLPSDVLTTGATQ